VVIEEAALKAANAEHTAAVEAAAVLMKVDADLAAANAHHTVVANAGLAVEREE
jgi:hypothetical protein